MMSHHRVKGWYSSCGRPIGSVLCHLGLAALLWLSTNTFAVELDRVSTLESLYVKSGVDSHLSWVHETVRSESQVARDNCEAKSKLPPTEESLNQLLSVDRLRSDYIAQLSERITDDELHGIVAFSESELGQRFHKAEADSLHLDENKFGQLLDELRETNAIDQARITAIKHMLADTGAVYFLSALNTELSSVVSIASVCSMSESDIAKAESTIREDRAAEALYRSFMRGELVQPALVVYRDLSNADLEAVSEFAKSDAGNAYYSALIQGIRGLLADKSEQLKLAMQSSAEQD